MKALKIIIVAVFIAAFGVGIYFIIPHKNSQGTDVIDEQTIKDCDLEFDRNYIEKEYKAIPDGEFKKLLERRKEMEGNYRNIMADRPEQCRKTVNLILRNRYLDRFVAMATKEFEGADWPHFKQIREMNSQLMKELTDNNKDLSNIKATCDKYSEVASFNGRVSGQSNQRASAVTSKWNFNNTRSLINSIPSATAPVDHTTAYAKTRSSEVKSRLYSGHVEFLKSLVRNARESIVNNPTESQWEYAVDMVSQEIELFKDKANSLYGKSYSNIYDVTNKLNTELTNLKSLTNQ